MKNSRHKYQMSPEMIRRGVSSVEDLSAVGPTYKKHETADPNTLDNSINDATEN